MLRRPGVQLCEPYWVAAVATPPGADTTSCPPTVARLHVARLRSPRTVAPCTGVPPCGVTGVHRMRPHTRAHRGPLDTSRHAEQHAVAPELLCPCFCPLLPAWRPVLNCYTSSAQESHELAKTLNRSGADPSGPGRAGHGQCRLRLCRTAHGKRCGRQGKIVTT